MNRQWLLFLALVAGAAFAHHGRMQEHLLNVQVLSAGRYAETSAGFVRTSGHVEIGAPVAPIEQTDRISLRTGERFGFCFQVSGFLEDGDADLQKIVTHPVVTAGDSTVSGYVGTIELNVIGGRAEGCIGHTLESGADLIAGRWTIALGGGETTLAERSFIVE
ncbi:MAG TPA: DUF3859 domain-containing protein [Burkholderiales bacterium]|nr:DUF3859 domain-containing protein [Burkholderiales bacterium]